MDGFQAGAAEQLQGRGVHADNVSPPVGEEQSAGGQLREGGQVAVQAVQTRLWGAGPEESGDEGGKGADGPLEKFRLLRHPVVAALGEGGEGQHPHRIAALGDAL